MVAVRAERRLQRMNHVEPVRRSGPAPVVDLTTRGPLVEGRGNGRKRVALRAWLMCPDSAARGYALDLSESGARLGGVGTRFEVGQRLLCKIELQPHEACVVVRAEVTRFHPVAAR